MFKENAIIICENDYKNKLLKEFNENKVLLNVNFMTKKEFLEAYFFSYNEKTLYYIYRKYQFKISIIKMYLDNLRFVQNKNYNNEKLDFLVKLKEELDKEKLLIYDDRFKTFLQDKTIYLAPYIYLENDEEKVFKSLNAIQIKNDTNYKPVFAQMFKTIAKEVNYVCKRIAKLILNGENINNIKLVNVPEEYKNLLERYAYLYNIPINLNINSCLYGTREAKLFLSHLYEGKDNALDKIKKLNQDIITKIVNICNKYFFIEDMNDLKTFLIYEFKKTNINQNLLENYVELVSINYPFKEEYVFLMNFNIESFPKVYKDDSYITDNIKKMVNLKSVNEINKIVKSNTINIIKSIKNIVITLKEYDLEKKVYPSSLIEDLDLEILNEEDDLYESYSILNDKLNYAMKLDDYYKYGILDDNIFIYKNTYQDINYFTYDSSYKKIKQKIFDKKIKLSYSSINKYFECKFKYFLSKVLYLDNYKITFGALIGSLYHHILKEYLENKKDIMLLKEEYLNNNNIVLTKKEAFYINKIVKEIETDLIIIDKQNTYNTLDKRVLEKEFQDNNEHFILNGFIDKILYNDKEELVIIDYKTGNENISYKLLSSGLSMQLFLYLYLVKKDSYFNNPKIIGFYLQHFLHSEKICDKSPIEQKEANLKLNGYSNKDISLLEKFDSSFKNSKVIRGMKLKNDGNFYSNSKTLSSEEMDSMVFLVEAILNEAVEKINNNDFQINPKKVNNKDDVSCPYCPYKEICYKKDYYYENIKQEEDLSFLGGDNND
ncbi:MAG: hypothetical protein GX951_04225 [Mollicutes bacterium]|nr:hypothetical protein [Mollicutes bacterium]